MHTEIGGHRTWTVHGTLAYVFYVICEVLFAYLIIIYGLPADEWTTVREISQNMRSRRATSHHASHVILVKPASEAVRQWLWLAQWLWLRRPSLAFATHKTHTLGLAEHVIHVHTYTSRGLEYAGNYSRHFVGSVT